jgi:fructokinase
LIWLRAFIVTKYFDAYNVRNGLGQFINILDPYVILPGSGLGNIESFKTRVKYILAHLFNTVLKTKIVYPALGDSTGVFAAAVLMDRE